MAIDTEYLRVKTKDTGHELTVSRTVYDFAPNAYELLEDQDATDAGNNPLPPTYAEATPPPTTNAGTPPLPLHAAPEKPASSADHTKENS